MVITWTRVPTWRTDVMDTPQRLCVPLRKWVMEAEEISKSRPSTTWCEQVHFLRSVPPLPRSNSNQSETGIRTLAGHFLISNSLGAYPSADNARLNSWLRFVLTGNSPENKLPRLMWKRRRGRGREVGRRQSTGRKQQTILGWLYRCKKTVWIAPSNYLPPLRLSVALFAQLSDTLSHLCQRLLTSDQ